MVEVDVHLALDDTVVAIHDRTLQRTTTGNGAVRSYRLEEIRTFDAGSWFDPSFADERVPTLEEVLQATGPDVWMNIELKYYPFYPIPREHLAQCVLQCVRKNGAINRVLFTSFDPPLLAQIRKLEPSASVGILHDWLRNFFRSPFDLAASIGAKAFICARRELRISSVSRARNRGMAVFVYTVNDSAEAGRLAGLGVDGLITDVADVLSKL